jgi:hypothetical protein
MANFTNKLGSLATRECRAPHPLARDRFYKLTWPQIVTLYRLTLDQPARNTQPSPAGPRGSSREGSPQPGILSRGPRRVWRILLPILLVMSILIIEWTETAEPRDAPG